MDGKTLRFAKAVIATGARAFVPPVEGLEEAGFLTNEITLAMVGKIGLGALSNVIHSYPTQAEAVKQAADAYNRTWLTPFVKKILGWWLAWTR